MWRMMRGVLFVLVGLCVLSVSVCVCVCVKCAAHRRRRRFRFTLSSLRVALNKQSANYSILE